MTKHAAAHIRSVLDLCWDAYTFPMLDNGYVYLAATTQARDSSAVVETGIAIWVSGKPTFQDRVTSRDPTLGDPPSPRGVGVPPPK